MKESFWLIIMYFLMGLVGIGIIGTAIFDQNDGEIFIIFLGIFTLSFAHLFIIGIYYILYYDQDSLYNVYFKSAIKKETNGDR